MSPSAYVEVAPASWEEICKTKHAARDAAISKDWRLLPSHLNDERMNVMDVPASCGILSDRELAITETSVRVLVRHMLSRKYSSQEVTLAFCKRAAISQQLVNCLSEVFFDKALAAAEALDSEYAISGIPAGPLHGLPVSLKDCFQIEGVDATIGYTAYSGKPASQEQESEITKIMRASGAVLFCKTNAPVAMMSGETYNAIYGYTSNPYNRNLSSGGSSGGEGALLALRGSPLGVGTDLGGSVRIPASFCGLYSLKPSFGRFPTFGIQDGLPGQETVRNVVGPMSSSLSGLELWCRSVATASPWIGSDPDCLPLPWKQPDMPDRLCIGLLLDDGHVKPHSSVTRALLETKAALEAAGHCVIEFTIDDPQYLEPFKTTMYRSAAAAMVKDKLSKTNEPWPRGYELLEKYLSSSSHGPSAFLSDATVLDLWNAQAKRTAYSKKLLNAWGATKSRSSTGREMDALLMPCTISPACPKYQFEYDNYTSLWNMLDYCATTMPVTCVSHDDIRHQGGRDKHGSGSANGENVTSACEEKGHISLGHSESALGCPVGVQLVGRRLNEEYLLGVTRVCHEALAAVGGHGTE